MTHAEETITVRVTRGVAAEYVGISVTRLVRYERMGLVSPARVRNDAMYGPTDLARLRKLRRLTEDLGVNLAGVEIILRLLDQLEEYRDRGS